MAPHPRNRVRGPPATTPGARSIQISKSLSWLLRHGAAKERIAMDGAGYVNVDDVLNWHKLRALNVEFEELIHAVKENEKQRYSLRINDNGANRSDAEEGTDLVGESPHARALSHIEASSMPVARDYAIRAVQGHSLKTVDAVSLLTPITLDNAPSTCVHGTFFISWPAILRSRGLKPMTRNHVHFATGPAVEDLLGDADVVGKEGLKDMMVRNQVVSGMRGDAQVLIYVDVRRAIQEGSMEWWKSENGVLLTEGIEHSDENDEVAPTPEEETSTVQKGNDAESRESQEGQNGDSLSSKSQKQALRVMKPPQKTVPIQYWDIVVGMGIGVLWRKGEGVTQEVPADMMRGGKRNMNKSSQPKKSGTIQNAKPRMRVERDDLDGFGVG